MAVSGHASGTGGGVEIGHYRWLGSDSLGVIVAADLAGYAGGNDADPILWTEVQLRYRRDLHDHHRSGPYFALGPAAGYSHGYIERTVAGAFFELGYEIRLIGPVALDLSLRERPAYFMSGGTPLGAFHNTLTLGLDLVILGATSER